jgi:hypothetical protein
MPKILPRALAAVVTATLVSLLGGCSSDPAAPFVGTWTLASETIALDCGGSVQTLGPPAGQTTYTFNETGPSLLVETIDGSSCDANWTVSGSTATNTGQNSCTDSTTDASGNPETIVVTPADSATVSGSTMTLELSGTWVITDPSATPPTQSCTFSGSGTLSKT